jgi:NADH dehydrogenase (ubiquinone) flavoprotein 2
MVQINDDYYEDLTPETVTTLLRALRDSAKAAGAAAGGKKAGKEAKEIPSPKAGPLSGRQTCENSAGQTNLKSEPWGTETTRSDL